MDPSDPSYYKDVVRFEEEVWTLPGMQRQQFLAAAYYLFVVQRQQRVSTRALDITDHDVSNTSSPELIDTFLDLLALLFARFKNKRKSPGNVTAAAWTNLLQRK